MRAVKAEMLANRLNCVSVNASYCAPLPPFQIEGLGATLFFSLRDCVEM